MALRLQCARPDLFGATIAISPGGAYQALRIPESYRSKVKISCAFASDDLRAAFVVPTAGTRAQLEHLGIPHLVQFMPDSQHDPASIERFLYAAFGFALE